MTREALITGGGRGIGPGFARAILGQGASVSVIAAREDPGEALGKS